MATIPKGANVFFSKRSEALAFQPQASVIATPATHHIELALELVRAGSHVLIEKPIAADSTKVPDLIDYCRERNLVLMVGYTLRFDESLQRFRALIREGRAGRILSVRAEVGQYLPSWRPTVDYRQTVSARSELGGGVLLELSHEIDYLRWIFGSVDWVSCSAAKQSALEINVDDVAHLVLGFSRGVIASVDLDFIRHDHTRRCLVIGDRGTLRWDGLSGRVDLLPSGSSEWTIVADDPPMRDKSFTAEWTEFIRCIAAKVEPELSGADALETLCVIEAARASAQMRRVVDVETMLGARAE
jgi:predicted dehydrogenase